MSNPARSAAPAPATPRQALGLAAGAVLAEINFHEHDTLGVDPALIDSVLRRDWGIENRAELQKTLAWLADGGHRREFELIGARARAAGQVPSDPLQLFRPDEFLALPIEEQVALRARAGVAAELLPAHRSLVAWDFGRLIMLARWGFTVGFLSEAEAWSFIERAAGEIEANFQSWLDVGENYLAGVRFWSKDDERLVDDTQAALDRLLDPDNAKSPWNRVPFPGAAANPNVSQRMAARQTARAKEHAGNLRNLVLLVAAVVIAIVAGRIVGPKVHPCERLDARLCADLGPAACEVWKGKLGKVGSGSAMPHEARGRRFFVDTAMHLFLGWDRDRSHETCSMQGNDAVYPAILEGVRATVAAHAR